MNNLFKDHAVHPLDQRNVRNDLHAIAAVRAHAASARNLNLDGLAPNLNPDRPNPNTRTNLRIRIGRDAARISRTTVRGATVIGKDQRRRAKARRRVARRARDPATSRNRNSPRTRAADPRWRVTIAKRRQQNRKLRPILYCLSSCL